MPKAKKPVVIVTRKLPDSIETRMRELFETRLNDDDKPMTQAQLGEALKTADVLVPTVTDRIDAAVLKEAGPNLKLIANFGNGVDNIDVAAAVQRGITVTRDGASLWPPPPVQVSAAPKAAPASTPQTSASIRTGMAISASVRYCVDWSTAP